MGHRYSVTMQNQTIIADGELVILRTANAIGTRASIILLHRAWCSQNETETSQQLGVMLALAASAFGTFTAATPTPHVPGGNASGLTGSTSVAAGSAGVDASANGAGTKTPIVYDGFNNLNGWLWVPTPEERILVPVDTAVVLKIVGTPTTLTGWNAGITYEEIN